MSQHDFSIANQGFPSFRSDLNDALQALVSNSSGATAPTTTYAHQMWVDTTADPSILKIRNADNDAWITLGNIDQTGDTFIYTPAAGSASAPAYSTSGDLNTGVFFPGADIVALAAGGSEKLMASTTEVVVNDGSADVDFRVESDADTHALFVEGSSGNVGVGASSPSQRLTVSGGLLVTDEIKGSNNLNLQKSTLNNIYFTDALAFAMSGTGERARIDSSGNVGIGTSSPAKQLQIESPTGGTIRLSSSDTSIGAGESLGEIDWYSNDSSSFGAGVRAFVNVVENDSGLGRAYDMTFGTGNVATATEKMRLDASGNLLVGTTDTDPADNNVVGTAILSGGRISVNQAGSALYVGRTNDGTLVTFFESGTVEGTISVSGTTVSYNGGHLARWSQLADNTKDETILKGTVMTNLDQMAEWTTDGVTEDNEQLNCMAVSSVEGDPNVAGVFVNWDNDDDVYTNDMNIAMTGDMIIRIAAGTTVARGDLLMSAGDGTAKPQGDDIVRSKTIAKVTSTHVTCTYADGSFCVPCVLMAC